MTHEFMVSATEIGLVDEAGFVGEGGASIWFGAVDPATNTVDLHADGSRGSIRYLARQICSHHTAAA